MWLCKLLASCGTVAWAPMRRVMMMMRRMGGVSNSCKQTWHLHHQNKQQDLRGDDIPMSPLPPHGLSHAGKIRCEIS